jgi:hypothetical protein
VHKGPQLQRRVLEQKLVARARDVRVAAALLQDLL